MFAVVACAQVNLARLEALTRAVDQRAANGLQGAQTNPHDYRKHSFEVDVVGIEKSSPQKQKETPEMSSMQHFCLRSHR